MNLYSLTIHELHEKLKNKEISSVELTESIFQRIAATEEKLHSFITLCHKSARAEAKKADELLSKDVGTPPPVRHPGGREGYLPYSRDNDDLCLQNIGQFSFTL